MVTAVQVALATTLVGLLISAIYDKKTGKIPPLVHIIWLGAVIGYYVAIGQIGTMVDGLIIGFIISYVLWVIGAVGGGDAKSIVLTYAVIYGVNPPAAELFIYASFVAILLKLARKFSVKKYLKSIELSNWKTWASTLAIVLASLPIYQIISSVPWTQLVSLYILGIIFWVMRKYSERAWWFFVYCAATISAAAYIVTGSIMDIITAVVATAVIVVLRQPLIEVYRNIWDEEIPLFTPTRTRKSSRDVRRMTAGTELLIGGVVAAATILINSALI
ncbi:MAG: hypothetical protein GXN93_03965 [Candidatus Diapherotrites archaeon]|nr:hypothetical protein [Candidatus Diapherotrites archaeon]